MTGSWGRATASPCLVCREIAGDVRVPGGPLESNALALTVHVPPLGDRDVYLGHLLVVPRRHVADFAGLDDAEASAVGVLLRRWSAALRATGAERVYVATIGHSFDHLHVHLLPRWPGTPADVPWHAVDEWSGARRGDFDDAAVFVTQLLAEA